MSTIGERRVRVDFNVAQEGAISTAVQDFKESCATLIDACEAMKTTSDNPELKRLASMAQTKFEEGAMLAVKAVTTPDDVAE